MVMLQTRIRTVTICACLIAALIAVADSWQSCPSTCEYSVDSYTVNLAPLTGIWEAVYFEKTSFATIPVFFNLSVCGQLPTVAPTPAVCRGGHVCYTEDFQEFFNLGSHTTCEYQVDKKVLSLSYNYGHDALPRFGVGNVTISFVCGPTMGVPQVLEGVPSRHVVEVIWVTSAVCNPSGPTAPKNETKCYSVHPVHDNGLKAAYVDLSGLIKDTGFSATTSERQGIRVDVSVCRPMKRSDGCDGSMACLVTGDKELAVHSKNLALSKLQGSRESATPHMEGDMLTVEYPISSDKVTDCDSPMVKIHFLCPTGDQVLGPHIDFIDNKLCLINIIWNTMHACEISTIRSKTCKLSTPFGLEFDISGLAKQPMNVTTTVGKSHYQYFLSPCSTVGLNSQCSGHSPQPPIRVTQTDLSSDACRSLGQGNGTLHYADNTLSLTYFSGDSCRNGISRTTIITLTCPGKVSSSCGSGNCVSFVTENECIYEFEWVTELACATKRSKFSCEFKLGGLSYDLGRLTEGVNPTFAAISYSNDTECYLINPCGELEGTNEQLTSAKYCNLRVVPQACWNSSVCQIHKQTPLAVAFGSFQGFDKNSLEAYDKNVFSVSTKAGSNGHQALIRYICETGRLQSFPVFISQVVTNVSEFHWPTYAACPQVSQVGSSCLVQEKSTGFSFNLTSLSGHTYVFNNSKYSYKIRVCDALPSGDCENGAAMCQMSGSHTVLSCGNPNSTLIYADSSLKLIYSGGHSCSGGDTRTTTMTFLCDPNAHQAVVENVTEIRHCEYLVEMRTKLACPPAYRATECVLFTPSGTVYDLRELSRLTGNWQAEGADGSVYVINVCRPLNLQGIGGCNPLSAACRITSNPASPNTDIGYASSAKLSVTSNGDALYLRYNYTNPSSDTQTSQCPKVSTNIKLTCNLAASTDSGPHFISGGDEANRCEYNFQWDTRAACPVKKQTTQNCSVTDTVKGYTFNLMPLRLNKHHYTVGYTDSSINKNGSFNVTVCGSLREVDSLCTSVVGESVCQQDSLGRNHSCGDFSTMSLSRIGETLHLSYSGGQICHHNKRHRSVEIDFVCDSQAEDFYGAPRYQQEFGNNCSYSFVWPTALACAPRKLTCRAGGGKYDLSPLLEAHHWVVLGEKDGYRYVIGGCNSLMLDSDPFCPHVPFMGGCKYKPDTNNTGVNLGFVTADLVVLAEGQLRLTYHNGEQCSNNGLRSMVHVNFHCQHGNGAGQPVLVPSSWDCLTQIDWATEYACPRDKAANQSTWIITNPVTHQTFDLTSISSKLSGSHSDSGTEYNYTIALGGSSISCGTSQDKNIGACQTKISDPTKTKILGRLNNLTLIDGKVHVVYLNGDVCHSTKKPRRASISFEYGPEERLVILPEQQCEYSFVVYTPLVRDNTPVIGQQCQVDNFEELDWFLSYKVPPIQINSSLTAYVSVCQPISSDNQLDAQGSSSCASSNSGACLVTSSGSKSLGKPNPARQPAVAPSGNGVILTYTGGDACNATHSYSAKLLLLCSNNSETNLPELVYPIIDSSHPFISQPCEFIFQLSSSHACPLATPSTKVSETVCAISDPADGTKFDLSSLTNDSHVMMEANGTMYVIGLCGPISNPPTGCSGRASICHRLGHNQWMPMVWANHSLTITYHSPHSIEVVFPGGSECQGSRSWSASINIYCSVSSSSNRPILISDTDCQLEFSWPTKLLCVNGIEGCFATDPADPSAVFDLEPLSNTKWTGQVVERDGKHLGTLDLRVCRNLNPTLPEGAHCSPGPSGICLNDPLTHKYVNLGYMSRPPVLVNGSVVLIYTDGDQCGNNNTVHTTIRLECHRELNGNQLNMQQISDCWYSGQWNTPLACKDKTEDSTSCVLQDSLTQRQYNFNPLARNISFPATVSIGDVSNSYSVCVCPSSQCSRLGARLVTTTSHGMVVLGKFTKMRVTSNGESQVLFENGDVCGAGKYSAMILMQCDRDSSPDGRLVYEKGLSFNCHKIFVWWTRVACLSQAVSCTVQDGAGKLYSFPQLYSATGHWTVTDSKNPNTYLLNICGPLHGANDTTCSGGASVCVKRKDGSYSDLALAGTQQITINSNGHPLVHFAGISSCASQHHASVSIEMLCGIRGLVFKRNDTCTYSFEWYTTFACGETTTSLETLDHCENQYTEKNGLYSFDLNSLRKPDSYKVKTKDGTYYFNLCSDASECGNNVAACFKSSSSNAVTPMASTDKTTLKFNSYWMQVTMASSTSNAHVVVTVICIDADEESQEQGSHPSTDQAILESNSGDQWVYIRMYTTRTIGCSKKAATTTQPPSTSPAGTSNVADSKAVIAGIIIAVVVGVILLLIIITILWNKNSRDYLKIKFCNLFAAKSNERVVYVRVPKPGDQLLNISDESSDEVEEEENVEEDTTMDTATLTATDSSTTAAERTKPAATTKAGKAKPAPEHHSDEELLKL